MSQKRNFLSRQESFTHNKWSTERLGTLVFVESETTHHIGLKVSALGFGLGAIGGAYGPVEEQEGISAIHAALEHGINFFDTSPFYGLTKVHLLLTLFKFNRQKLFLEKLLKALQFLVINTLLQQRYYSIFLIILKVRKIWNGGIRFFT